jgi:methylated-DNA-[protein]-cysteine S-methyltransferase
MNAEIRTVINSPIGQLKISVQGNRLCRIELLFRESVEAPLPEEPQGVIPEQLRAYFADGSCRFSLSLDVAGTPFQQRVWQALRRIPCGTTRTYGEIAGELGTSARAVGNACRANPLPLVIPCHRVVSARGIGGFSGGTAGKRLAVKRWLLAHEGVHL